MVSSPPGSSVRGISQARILEWVAISSSRGSSQPKLESRSPALQVDSLPSELTNKQQRTHHGLLSDVTKEPPACLGPNGEGEVGDRFCRQSWYESPQEAGPPAVVTWNGAAACGRESGEDGGVCSCRNIGQLTGGTLRWARFLWGQEMVNGPSYCHLRMPGNMTSFSKLRGWGHSGCRGCCLPHGALGRRLNIG